MKQCNPSPWSRLDWLNLLLFALLVALFYWRILTPNLADRQSFPPGDFAHQFWAFATFEVRELSAGRLPLWNPYTFAGAPFWADVQSAVFYPLSLVTILLSAPWGFSLFALEIEAIVHFWLAAVFMYLFSRRLTHSRPAAFIAALTFTFSGYLTGYPSQQLAVLEADVWLPLILFFLHNGEEGWKNGRVEEWKGDALSQSSLIFAGIAWGLTLLAGHPQSALIVAYISVAYLSFLYYEHRRAKDKGQRTKDERPLTDNGRQAMDNGQSNPLSPYLPISLSLISNLSLFLLTGLGLAAIQFIPAAEYTLLSVRAAGAYDAMSGGFPLIDLIQFLLPGQISVYSPLYISIIGLILAVWVTFTRPSRSVIFWAILASVSLLISFGGNTFLYSPLYLTTPGFAIFRGQERWAFATAFSLCVLVGYGVQGLLEQVASRKVAGSQVVGGKVAGRRSQVADDQQAQTISQSPISNLSRLQSLTNYLFFFALLLTFLCFYGLNDTGWKPDSPFFNLLGAATFLTILLALTWLLWKLAATLPMPPALITFLIAILIGVDLFSVNWQTNLYPQLPEWHTQMPAIVSAIKTDAAASPEEPYRVYNEFRLYDNYGVPFAIEDLWGASPLRPARYDQFLAPPMPIERTWALLNVKYVITWREELFASSTIIYQEPADAGATYVHRLSEVGPRAWLVAQAEIADDPDILETIADPNFNPRQTALLEPNANLPFFTLQSLISNLQYTLRPTSYTPSRLSFDIDTPTPALLILSETYYPGWQAAVDDKLAPLLRANYILRAVPLPAGAHTVDLIFRPLSFMIGAIISLLTMVAIAGYLGYTWRQSQKIAAPEQL